VEPISVPPDQPTITIEDPVAEDTISSPVLVKGSTNFGPFESSLSVHIKDAGGAIIGIGSVMVQAPDIGLGGPFEGEVAFTPPATAQAGTLEVVEISAKDGSVVVMASVPVRLAAQDGPSSTSDPAR